MADGARSVGRSAAVVAGGTLVSRLLGFVNALLLYNTIGAVGDGADAFSLANQLPNNIYAIIAGGTLTAVIVPAIVRAASDADGGRGFLNKLVTLGVSLFGVIAIAVTAMTPLIVQLYAQGSGADGRGFSPEQMQLAFAFAYWCLPQVFFYALFAILSEVLNARGVFWPYAWAPVVNNVVFIGVLLGFQAAFGVAAGLDASAWTPQMIVLLAGGATTGIALQSLVLTLAWRRAGLRFRPDFRWRGVGLGHFGRLAGWMFATVLVMQAGGIVESNVVSLATGSASIATMSLSWLIFMLPYSIITVSLMIPYFTRMSEHVRDGRLDLMGRDLHQALTVSLMLLTFASIAIVILAQPIAVLFTSTVEGRLAVVDVLTAYLVGLVPFSVSMVLQRGFFALQDTRTSFLIQAGQVVLFVLALLAIANAPSELIATLTALALSGALTISAIVSVVVMSARAPFGVGRLLLHWIWYALAMVPAAAAGLGVLALLDATEVTSFPEGGWPEALLAGALGGVTLLVVYLGVLWITRNPALGAFAAPVLARLRRGPRSGTE